MKAAQINVSLPNLRMHGRIYISEIWDDIKEVNAAEFFISKRVSMILFLVLLENMLP